VTLAFCSLKDNIPSNFLAYAFIFLTDTTNGEITDSIADVEATASFFEVEVYSGEVDVCDEKFVTSDDDSYTCPSSETSHSFSLTKLSIPDLSDSWYVSLALAIYGSVDVNVYLEFSTGSSRCTATFKEKSSSESGSAYFVGSFVALVGLVTVGLRRRRVATIKLQEDEGTTTHFEMMPNDNFVRV
jgi:hypothetical protein